MYKTAEGKGENKYVDKVTLWQPLAKEGDNERKSCVTILAITNNGG